MKNKKSSQKDDPKIKMKESNEAGWGKLKQSGPSLRAWNYTVPVDKGLPSSDLGINKEVQVIELVNIQPNPNQPRKIFSPADLKELADSINNLGLLEPILVRPKKGTPGQFEIIAGERRFRACLLNNLKEILAIVKNVSDNDAFTIALTENLVRKTLNPIEEALGYKKLLELNIYKNQTDMAERLGIERTRIVKLLGFFEYLSEDAMNFYLKNDGSISEGHLQSFMRKVPLNDQTELLQRIKDNAWSVKNTRQYVAEKYLNQSAVTPINPIKISEKAEDHFDISVHIRPNLAKEQLGEILITLEKQIVRIKALANAGSVNG
jgi:ParB family chromosome partitioning protein